MECPGLVGIKFEISELVRCAVDAIRRMVIEARRLDRYADVTQRCLVTLERGTLRPLRIGVLTSECPSESNEPERPPRPEQPGEGRC